MDITDIYNSADYFKEKYIEHFYIIVTYNGNGFILVGEKENFPHLVGIQKNVYNSNGYRNPKQLYIDILNRTNINTRIIPNNIAQTSKMYKKVRNFNHSFEVFVENKCPAIIKYDPSKSTLNLQKVDVLLTDLVSGYMLGWVLNNRIQINGNIRITKYCISTWIDESGSNDIRKQKYMPQQEIELLRHVLVFDHDSELIKKKDYKYTKQQKLQILQACHDNNCNLLIDDANADKYIGIAKTNSISCTINGNPV